MRATDLTRGRIGKKLLLFMLPLLLSSLVQQLYNAVDLIFAGHALGSAASSAIGISSLLVTCLVGFFGGVSVGAAVVASQLCGAGDRPGLQRAIRTAGFLSLAGGALLMLLGYALAPVYLRLVGTPAGLYAGALCYLRIYILSFIPALFYNIGSGVLRALGDSRAALLAQLAGGLANAALDALFLALFANGIAAVAWATLFSQTIAALAVLRRLARPDTGGALRLRALRPDGAVMKKLLALGVPAGMQSLVITLSNVIAQSRINTLGEDAIAAFTAYFKVELVIYLPIMAFGQAVMTFAGQNSGAGNQARVRSGTRRCLIAGAALTLALSALALLLGRPLFSVFSDDPAVIAVGRSIIGVTFPFYFIYLILQVLGDSLRGTGRVRGPMLIVMSCICIIRTALLFAVVPRWPDVRAVALTYPVTWALAAAGMAAYYIHCRRQDAAPPEKHTEILGGTSC